MKEAYVYVRAEDVDAGEGDISEAGVGTAVVEDFVAGVSHLFPPVVGYGCEVGGVVLEPGLDCGILFERVVEAE